MSVLHLEWNPVEQQLEKHGRRNAQILHKLALSN